MPAAPIPCVPHCSVLFHTLFILYINDMQAMEGMHCYADDSAGDASYRPSEFSLGSWYGKDDQILCLQWITPMQLNLLKTDLRFHFKHARLWWHPSIGMSLQPSTSIEILGVEVSSNVQYWSHLDGKAKLTSKMLGALNRAKHYSKPFALQSTCPVSPRVLLPPMAGALKYQLLLFECTQKRFVRIVLNIDLTWH